MTRVVLTLELDEAYLVDDVLSTEAQIQRERKDAPCAAAEAATLDRIIQQLRGQVSPAAGS